MRTPVPKSQAWEQQQLLVPEVLELTLRVGLVVSTEHAQLQLEITDPSSETLLGLVSRPHVHFAELDTALLAICRELTEFVSKHSGPFPEQF